MLHCGMGKIADFLDTGAGRSCCGVAIALLICSPAILFKLPGFMLVIGGVFGFWGGYSFARHEWRRLGFVPKYEDTEYRETVNGSVPSARQRQRGR